MRRRQTEMGEETGRKTGRIDGGAYVRCCELHLLKGDDSPILSNYSLTLSLTH